MSSNSTGGWGPLIRCPGHQRSGTCGWASLLSREQSDIHHRRNTLYPKPLLLFKSWSMSVNGWNIRDAAIPQKRCSAVLQGFYFPITVTLEHFRRSISHWEEGSLHTLLHHFILQHLLCNVYKVMHKLFLSNWYKMSSLDHFNPPTPAATTRFGQSACQATYNNYNFWCCASPYLYLQPGGTFIRFETCCIAIPFLSPKGQSPLVASGLLV